MALPGFEAPERFDPLGQHVVIACSRHVRTARSIPDDAVAVVEVPCAGMLHAQAIGALMQAGATEVQVVGCAPGDCAYGFGNVVLSERLAGVRAPHVPKRWAGTADVDWVSPGELIDAIAAPHRHPEVDAGHLVRGRRLVGAIAVVAVSVVAVALATQAPYRGDAEATGLRVIVDHVPGRVLQGRDEPSGDPGDSVDVVVRADGTEVAREPVSIRAGAAVGVVDVELGTGDVALSVALAQGTTETTLFDGVATLAAGRRLVVEAVDVPPPPGISEGRDVFADRSLGGCGVCHSTSPGDDGVGPSLSGVADRAANRVPGLAAEDYLHQSIVDPQAYVVDGYRADQMLPIYADRLSQQQIDALVAYLLSLGTAAGEGAPEGGAPDDAAPEDGGR
jgi:mono/diheme cytochrome c family protein